ncbi:MAG: deoxyguanosinetriphosphate triphosphohydrolase [Candidatus Tectomicrobia bacterium]|nr:deoxyguanosinetriphosphate triphosphohydrolase [Candidatus Tectomicrobia bacterium]
MLTRQEYETSEAQRLAPYAVHSGASRGRKFPEPEHPYRTAFQRDRDRIVHSSAFRRLEYKTQVFVYHEGDYYRTRLTHSMEVAQISRTIARVLRLNEELAETVALSHDLGHTPFGHCGERVMAELMKEFGGFEHNRQSLRVVEVLEHRYPNFPGLNLTWEAREGILMHAPVHDHPDFSATHAHPSLEAQIADLADEIAYNNHDIDDGLKSNLLTLEQLEEVELWQEAYRATFDALLGQPPRVIQHQTVRRLINELTTDLVEETAHRIVVDGVETVDDVRGASRRIAGFSPEMQSKAQCLKEFLYRNMYQHFRVVRMGEKAGRILRQLFEAYIANPEQLPPNIKQRLEEDALHTVVCDYLAGMTDRYALEEYKKLFDPFERV